MQNHKILSIGLNTSSEEKDRIQTELLKKNISLDIASIKDPIFKIIEGIVYADINGNNLTGYEYVWIQSGWNTTHMAYLLHIYLTYMGIPHNIPSKQDTKITDIFSLAINNVSVPNTFFHNGLKINDTHIDEIERICNIPCIYKKLSGSLGSQVFLIQDKSLIYDVIRENRKYNSYIFQQYIPNDFDYRVVIANELTTSVCKRTRVSDSYRNNVALGASEEFIDIEDTPIDILELAQNASKILNLNWAGVDIVVDKETNKNYILEVNRRPGLTENSTEISAFYSQINGILANIF